MRGRRPKPTAMKVAAGNPGKRPLNAAEPKPAAGPVECPAELDGAARREWDRIAPILTAMGVLTPADATGLAVYCQTWSDYLRYCRTLARKGHIVHTSNGNVVQSPFVGMRNRSALILANYLGRFGLTPADRVRLQTERSREVDAFAAFVSRRSPQREEAADGAS